MCVILVSPAEAWFCVRLFVGNIRDSRFVAGSVWGFVRSLFGRLFGRSVLASHGGLAVDIRWLTLYEKEQRCHKNDDDNFHVFSMKKAAQGSGILV